MQNGFVVLKIVWEHINKYKMRTIIANYSSSTIFQIPKSLKLLSKKENDKIHEENIPFSWWIKWDTLNYYDENGEVQKIEGDNSSDMKRPDDVEEEEEDDEDEDDD